MTHGGLDDDFAVQEAVIRHIKGPAFTDHVHRPTQAAPRNFDDATDSREARELEATVVKRVARPRAGG